MKNRPCDYLASDQVTLAGKKFLSCDSQIKGRSVARRCRECVAPGFYQPLQDPAESLLPKMIRFEALHLHAILLSQDRIPPSIPGSHIEEMVPDLPVGFDIEKKSRNVDIEPEVDLLP